MWCVSVCSIHMCTCVRWVCTAHVRWVCTAQVRRVRTAHVRWVGTAQGRCMGVYIHHMLRGCVYVKWVWLMPMIQNGVNTVKPDW